MLLGSPGSKLVYITFEAANGNVTHSHNFITGFPWVAGVPAGGINSLTSPPFIAGLLPPLISVFATDAVTYLNIFGGDQAGGESYSGVAMLASPVSVLPLAAANPTGILSIVAVGDVAPACIATARHAAREVFNLHFPWSPLSPSRPFGWPPGTWPMIADVRPSGWNDASLGTVQSHQVGIYESTDTAPTVRSSESDHSWRVLLHAAVAYVRTGEQPDDR